MSQSILQRPDGESAPRGTKLDIKRLGGNVQINLQCGDDYQAMEIYDRLVEAAKRGELRVDLKMR